MDLKQITNNKIANVIKRIVLIIVQELNYMPGAYACLRYSFFSEGGNIWDMLK